MQTTYQPFEIAGRYGRGRYQDAGMTQAILFATAVSVARPELRSFLHGGSPITPVVLPFPRAGDAAITSVVSVSIDRPAEAAPEGAAERVRALRAWIDSLPPVPPVPLEALDRSALY